VIVPSFSAYWSFGDGDDLAGVVEVVLECPGVPQRIGIGFVGRHPHGLSPSDDRDDLGICFGAPASCSA
jgi:hypothetical protein